MYQTVRLRKKRSSPALTRHPWIFSGGLETLPDGLRHGDTVRVETASGDLVGTGQYSSRSMIAVRLYSFDDATIDQSWIRTAIARANGRRLLALPELASQSNSGYRMVFGESDWLPGLVIDRFADTFVIQIGTEAMNRRKLEIEEILTNDFSPSAIVDRSDLSRRTEEGLEPFSGLLYGGLEGPVHFEENSLHLIADVTGGQKTGFFLDQRLVRSWLRSRSRGRKAVDLFCYSGAMGLNALAGAAEDVTFVDSSDRALEFVREHVQMNNIEQARTTIVNDDVFQWLGNRSEPEFDLVILDPPALIKSRKHTAAGQKGYHFLNRAAMRILRNGGILVSSSCSQFMTEEDLVTTLRKAAEQAGVTANILARIPQSPDHPQSLYFPEATYLKTVAVEIQRPQSSNSERLTTQR